MVFCDCGIDGSLFYVFGFMLGSCVLFAALCGFCTCGFSCLVNLVAGVLRVLIDAVALWCFVRICVVVVLVLMFNFRCYVLIW